MADLTDSDDVVVVGFLGDDHNVERKAFEDAAYSLHETPFGLADPDLASNFDVAAPAVVVFKTFDERKAIFEGDYEKGLLKFIRDSSLPLIMEFSQENAPKIFGGDVDTHMLLFVDVNADESQIEEAKETAKLYKGEILFVTISKSDDRILEFFDVAEEDMPAIRLVHMGEGDMKKYRFKGTIHKDALTSFIEKYKSGDLVPELKSEEPPQSNDGPVKTVVGKTFDDIVLDPKRDVFVQMMAPWCGHCKRLAPVWEDLGRKLQPYDGIVIAKMDATANEHERVDISGFPTLKFWAAGAEDPVDFDGSRDMEGFVNFLKEHSSTDFDVVIDNEEL